MGQSDVVILIPARMASVRLPGKPLADIGGAPMIGQVVRGAAAAGGGRGGGGGGAGGGGDGFRSDRRCRNGGRWAGGDDARRSRVGLGPYFRGAGDRRS